MTAPTLTIAPNSATETEIKALFDAQAAYAPQVVHSDYRHRKANIQQLLDYTLTHIDEIAAVIHQDFGKHKAESLLSEIMVVVQEAKHTLKHLRKWMRPKRVSAPLTLIGTASRIRYEAKGQVLIISPWNYPFNLTMGPLISALAAGNVVMIKPSEMTPHTSAFMRKMIAELFDPREVSLVEGDHRVGQALLKLPFNHIFFTRSPTVGKIVMRAAAEHLTSVTLELGGKSPAIVDGSYDPAKAGEKIAWAKSFNNGQTCIAPDYVLVKEDAQAAFVAGYQAAITALYGSDPQQSDSYCRIVNDKHFGRVKGLLDDALETGAELAVGGHTDATSRYIAPTVLTHVKPDMRIMQEEIFGPVLPVLTYRDDAEALRIIQGLERPLAMYLMSKHKPTIDRYMDSAISGDVMVNDLLMHFAHPGLPFGGVNNSGIGKSGGWAGFREFSHERSVMVQQFGTLKPFYPPYTPKLTKLIQGIQRWL